MPVLIFGFCAYHGTCFSHSELFDEVFIRRYELCLFFFEYKQGATITVNSESYTPGLFCQKLKRTTWVAFGFKRSHLPHSQRNHQPLVQWDFLCAEHWRICVRLSTFQMMPWNMQSKLPFTQLRLNSRNCTEFLQHILVIRALESRVSKPIIACEVLTSEEVQSWGLLTN